MSDYYKNLSPKFPSKLHVVPHKDTDSVFIVPLPYTNKAVDAQSYDKRFASALSWARIRYDASADKFVDYNNAPLDDSLVPFIIDNNPTKNYTLVDVEKRIHRYGKNIVWDVKHPDNFVVNISSINLAHLLETCTVIEGVIQDELVMIRVGTENVLTKVKSELYDLATQVQKNITTSVKSAPGSLIRLKTGEEGIFLGKNLLTFFSVKQFEGKETDQNIVYDIFGSPNTNTKDSYIIVTNHSCVERKTFPSITVDNGVVHQTPNDMADWFNTDTAAGHGGYIYNLGYHATTLSKDNYEVVLKQLDSIEDRITKHSYHQNSYFSKGTYFARDNVNGGFGLYNREYGSGSYSSDSQDFASVGKHHFFFKPYGISEQEQLELLSKGIIKYFNFRGVMQPVNTQANTWLYSSSYNNKYKAYTSPLCIGVKELNDSLLNDPNYSFYELMIMDKITGKLYSINTGSYTASLY